MLFIHQLQGPQDKFSKLQEFLPEQQTWVLADLQSKQSLQLFLLEKFGFYREQSVLRASELWKSVLFKLHPDLRFVSQEFLQSYLRELLELETSSPGAQTENMLIELMTDCAPIWLHTQGSELMHQWLEELPRRKRFEKWYALAHRYFLYFIDKKIVLPKWSSAILQQSQNWTQLVDSPLIVDLEAELSPIEAELLRDLSQKVDVHILQPAPNWSKSFDHLIRPYELISGFAKVSSSVPHRYSQPPQTQALKVTSPLAEVKLACWQVRQWLEQGFSTNEIAILSPNPSAYEVQLKAFFDQEGIPLDTELSSGLHSHPSISEWLAKLRLADRQVSFAELQEVYSQSKLSLRSEKFNSSFETVLDAEDLSLRNSYSANVNPISSDSVSQSSTSKKMDAIAFIELASELWNSAQEAGLMQNLLIQLLTEAEGQEVLSLSGWIKIFESYISRQELAGQGPGFHGVKLLDLRAGGFAHYQKRIFLGLSQKSLQLKEYSLWEAQEIDKLALDYGFFLNHPEQSLLEFQFRWLLELDQCENLLLFAATNQAGDSEAPHPLWMKYAKGTDFSVVPQVRWDHLQAAELEMIAKERDWALKRHQPMIKQLEQDMGQFSLVKVPLSSLPNLSASSLEKYRNCAFQYFSEKVLKLLDLPLVDLDLDLRSKGLLAHALFEELSRDIHQAWSDQDLDVLCENLRAQLPAMDQQLWNSLKKKHLLLARKFLLQEQQWQRQFPKLGILAREQKFEFSYSHEGADIKFKGQIDRIDAMNESEGPMKVVLVDYKARDKSSYSFDFWIRDNSLQLGLYSWALDRGLIVLEQLNDASVAGACYYDYKSFQRKRGFQLGTEFGDAKLISEEKKEQMYAELESILNEVLKGLREGNFAPEPRETKICEYCAWSGLCRSPHLNT